MRAHVELEDGKVCVDQLSEPWTLPCGHLACYAAVTFDGRPGWVTVINECEAITCGC